MFHGLFMGFGIAFSPTNLLFAMVGALLGTIVGILPGLGPAATISLLLPVSFKIGSPVTSIIMMAGIFYGAMYGGFDHVDSGQHPRRGCLRRDLYRWLPDGAQGPCRSGPRHRCHRLLYRRDGGCHWVDLCGASPG